MIAAHRRKLMGGNRMQVSGIIVEKGRIGPGRIKEVLMLTVAVVEDDTAAAERLEACLDEYSQSHGIQFNTVLFQDPVRFLNPYSAQYDIVFMDIEMPSMDGLEAAKQLRRLDQGVVLVFVTNLA